MSSRDFLTKRIRTKSIIGSGNESSSPSLLIYPGSSAIDNTGQIKSGMLDNVGTDVINFFSGSIGSMVYENEEGIVQPNNGERGVNLFGGDIHVSGTLFVQGSVISNDQALGSENLKGYAELGEFTLTQEVLGDNVIAIGNDLSASSNNSIVIGYDNSVITDDDAVPQLDKHKFIIGGASNTVLSRKSFIYGGFENEISGSGTENLVLGGTQNVIHSEDFENIYFDSRNSTIISSTSARVSGSINSLILNSQTTKITVGAHGNIAINSTGLDIIGTSRKNIVFGDNTEISAVVNATSNEFDQEKTSDSNFIFSSNSQIKQSSKNIVFGLNYGSTYDPTNIPRGNLSLTGSNESFIVGKNNLEIDNSRENFIYSGNSQRKNSDIQLVGPLATKTSIDSVTGSFIFGDNLQITSVNDSFIAATNELQLS